MSASTASTPTTAGDWNRETSIPHNYDKQLPILQEARILVIGDPKDESMARVYDENNWSSSNYTILGIGNTKEALDWDALQKTHPTILLVTSKGTRDLLAECLTTFSSAIQWVHARSAGIEHCTSPTLAATPPQLVMTNAKGHFSSTLAEYGMMACSYFAKDLPRLLQQHADKNWQRYDIVELRGATMGIVGYGDIGRATAKLTHAYGMKVVALKRKRTNAGEDPYCDEIYYSQENPQALNQLCAQSDYIFVAAPLTPQTKGLIGKEQFGVMKSTAVLINVGRGPVIDEDALIEALQSNKLKGAGLDVFSEEPLPKESKLWDLTKKVLLSPYVI